MNPYMTDPFTYGSMDPSLMAMMYPGGSPSFNETMPGSPSIPIPGQPTPAPGPAPAPTGGTATTQEQALQMALQTGLTGQAAVDWVQQNYPQFNQYGSGIEYTAGNNTYGGNGWYAAPGTGSNAQYGYDWITRSATGGSPSGGLAGSNGALGAFTPNIPTSGWSPDPRTNDLYGMLSGMAKTDLNINPNDPIIRNQTDAFSAAETRQQRNYLSDLAEKGGGTDNLNMETRMSSEKVGQDTAGFQAQLMGSELSARRQEIEFALSGMQGFLSDQEKMELQNQLAIMDNLLGQAGLQEGAYQFDQNNQFRNSPMGGGF